MPSYITQSEFTTRFDETEIKQILGVTASGTIVSTKLDDAVIDAEAEVDSYLAQRYDLPLDSAPTRLKNVVCDIVRYRIYDDRASEEVRDRYKDAVKWLTALAKGQVTLGVAAATAPVGGVATTTVTRRFSRFDLDMGYTEPTTSPYRWS